MDGEVPQQVGMKASLAPRSQPGTEYLCKFVKAGQDFPIFMSSLCIMAIACDRFRFIVQNQQRQMTATCVSAQDLTSRSHYEAVNTLRASNIPKASRNQFWVWFCIFVS